MGQGYATAGHIRGGGRSRPCDLRAQGVDVVIVPAGIDHGARGDGATPSQFASAPEAQSPSEGGRLPRTRVRVIQPSPAVACRVSAVPRGAAIRGVGAGGRPCHRGPVAVRLGAARAPSRSGAARATVRDAMVSEPSHIAVTLRGDAGRQPFAYVKRDAETGFTDPPHGTGQASETAFTYFIVDPGRSSARRPPEARYSAAAPGTTRPSASSVARRRALRASASGTWSRAW